MIQMSHNDWLVDAVHRFGPHARDWRFVCPRCETVQTLADLEAAGVETEHARRVIGFSCVGRYTKDKGCDWTLGGLFKIHALEVLQNGEVHPTFAFAEVEEPAMTVPEAFVYVMEKQALEKQNPDS